MPSYVVANTIPRFVARPNTFAISGGSYTLTLFGDTTAAIAYNDTVATIATRLNALAGVINRGGCVVTGDGFVDGHINFEIQFNNPLIVPNVSLTPVGATVTAATNDSGIGRSQQLVFVSGVGGTRTVRAPANGITAGDVLYARSGDTYISGITSFTVSGENIVFTGDSGPVFLAAATITEIGRRFKKGYTANAVLSRVKRVTDFFLPGVTPGITTVDDIPLPTYQGDPVSLLTAIFSGQTSINFEIGELTPWRDSPIIARTVTTLNAARLT